MAITSAIYAVAIPSATVKNIINYLKMSFSIYHNNKKNVAIPSATMAKIISHIKTTWQRTSVNNIKWFTNY